VEFISSGFKKNEASSPNCAGSLKIVTATSSLILEEDILRMDSTIMSMTFDEIVELVLSQVNGLSLNKAI
jgi:hypothetical protein